MMGLNKVGELIFPMPKPREMLCGNACIKALEICYAGVRIASVELARDMHWVAELACCLSRSGVKVSLHCWDSNLYEDYLMAAREVINEFDGFKFLSEYECSIGKVRLTRPRPSTIRAKLKEGPLIICVSSAIWHQDDNRSGGHFVILLDWNDDICLVADPGKEDIKLRQRKISDVIQAMAPFGSWRIYCKIPKNR